MKTRGAANDAFEALFALPFGQRVVDKFRFGAAFRQETNVADRDIGGSHFRSYAGATLVSVGALGAAAAAYALVSAHVLERDASQGNASQLEIAETNQKAKSREWLGAIGVGAAGAVTAAGLLLLLWPEGHSDVSMDPKLGALSVGVHGTF